MFLPTYTKKEDYNMQASENYYNAPKQRELATNTVGYNYQPNGPVYNSSLHYSDSNQNTLLRSRPNALRLPQVAATYSYQDPYSYSMDHCASNGMCGPVNASAIHSPGLKEVLATYTSGSTILCVEPRKDSKRGFKCFKLSIQAIIFILIIAGLCIVGTCIYLGVELNAEKTKFSESPAQTNNAHLPEDLHFQDSERQGGGEQFRYLDGKSHSFGARERKVFIMHSNDDDDEASVEVVPL